MTVSIACPSCSAAICSAAGQPANACGACGFPIGKWRSLGGGSASERVLSDRAAIEFQNAGAMISLGDRDAILGRGEEATPSHERAGQGSAAGQTRSIEQIVVRHREVQPSHVALLVDEQGRRWVVDLQPQMGVVFHNGWRQEAVLLAGGDVLQIGPLAWRFDEAQQRLQPVTPIRGFGLRVDAEVPGRLERTRLGIEAAKMTAVVGPSGCGKSTLLETIRDGSGLPDDSDVAGKVYFVPQKDLVHHDLRLGESLAAIGRLYGREVLPFQIDEALDAVGLSPQMKSKFPAELSGGQLRRFRIAGALVSGAGVIVLDEPDSGLDHRTADEVIGLLRSLAVRGATIIAVTHHQHVLAMFDHVIEMDVGGNGGRVVASPANRGDAAEPDRFPVEETIWEAGTVSWFRRLTVLIGRERRKLTSPRMARFLPSAIQVPHCLVHWLLVPLLFAVAIAVSVPTDPDRDVSDGLYGQMAPMIRLGFLSVVSVIWMSASQSHLSITRDREVYDYELSHGLGWAGILGAKSVVLSCAGMIQTAVFFAWLYAVRYQWLDRSFFVDERATQWIGVSVCLLLVSVSATLLGLLISAAAGRAPLVAAAVLPVIMMVQILFSAPFAVSDPDGYEPLADYDRLTVFSKPAETDEPDDEWLDDGWGDDAGADKPLSLTSWVSYATLSRYGDKWLRSFAVTLEPVEDAERVQYQSAAALAIYGGIAMGFSYLMLWLQTSRIGIRRGIIASAVMFAAIVASGAPGVPLDAAEPGGDIPDGADRVTITLPIVDGRYDENQFRKAFGGHVEATPRWRTFGNQDRLGLVALELVGKIEFELTADELTLTLNRSPIWDLVRQLAPPRLLGAEQVSGGDPVIVFVHGLEGGASTFAAAVERLDALGIASMRFDYPNDGPPDEIGDRLAEQLNTFHQSHPGAKIHLVAHSLGGLVATWAVTGDTLQPGVVETVVTLGTPFRGSALAGFHEELELFDVVFRLVTVQPNALNTIADGRGEAAEALVPGSVFLSQLRGRERPLGTAFHLAAGTKSFLSRSQRERLAARLPAELARLRISPAYAERIKRLMDARELEEGKGDGAVTVESALGLSDPSSRRTFPLTHTGLVSSAQSLEWVLQTVGLAKAAKELAK